MLQVKSGDTDKLGLLFERYNRALFGYFMRMTGCPSLSEDLVQDVFVRILKYRHTYKDEGSFMTWLFRIARNTHIDHYRKAKRNVAIEEKSDPDKLAGENPDEKMNEVDERRIRLDQESPGTTG